VASRGARLPAALILLTAVTAVTAGCAAVPSGGAPQAVKGGSSQAQAYVLPMPPPPPAADWFPSDVVLGFLHASASSADDWSAARKYLVPALRKTWKPGPVTVVSQTSKPTTAVFTPQQQPQPGKPTVYKTVTFTGQQLATLSESGQYQYTPRNNVYTFTLAQVNGVWLISGLPDVLLLTQADFEDVYQPRNLYFFAHSVPSDELVPDPVFAPIQGANYASNTSLASGLVNGLMTDRGSWLSAATSTAFPAGTTLLGLTISGQTATVNLGGKALRAGGIQIEEMAAQLRETLTTGTYSPPLAKQVELEIGGKAKYAGVQLKAIAQVNPAEPLLYQTGPSSVGERLSAATQTRAVLGPAQIGGAVITAMAAPADSPGSQLAVAVHADRGCAVYIGAGGTEAAPIRSYQVSRSGGACTSLSWDKNGNVWAVAGPHIWLFRQQHRAPVAVGLPAALGIGRSGLRVLALRMAPDGVRAALLVKTPSGNRLLLAAVSYSSAGASFGPAVTVGTDLSGVAAVSWYDPYHLVVLAAGGIYEVPLTGGAATQLGQAPDEAQTLTTSGTELAVGTAKDQVWTSHNAASSWGSPASGSVPVFPG
jgi:hypothetical protein